MKHLAIIADGNRRWANENGLPKKMGYLQGLTVIERCCEWAILNHIPYISVYCFSTENWGRPQHEVDLLMDLARWYFDDRKDWYVNAGVKVQFSGRRDRFDMDFIAKMENMESATSNGNNITLTICVDYGGRDEIVRAIKDGASTEEEISMYLSHGAPDPDVVLRTGGNQRLSNFMLWQAAYSELMFIDTYFPDLYAGDLDFILESIHSRKRNYGK